MTTRQQQSWGVGMLAAIAIVLAFVVIMITGAAMASAPSGSFSVSSPSGGFRADQSWFLFDGNGETCHVESWSDNPNRSLHDNFLVTVDTNGTTTHLAVERFQGTTDRGLWDSTETGEVYLQLTLGDDQRSSANYHAEWTCEEAPTSTTTPSTVTTSTLGGSTTTSIPPDTTVTTAPPTTIVSTTVTTVPVTTSTSSPPSSPTVPSTSTPPTSSTTKPSIPTGVETGIG